MRITRATIASVLLLAACGGPSVSEVAAETSANLRSIRSGLLELRVTLSPDDNGPPIAGAAVLGSFERADPGRLPVGDLTVEDLASGGSSSSRIVTTGDTGFVRVDGAFYKLPPDRVDPSGTARDGEGLFAGVSIADWLRDPELGEGEGLDGLPVDRIRGELAVEAAFEDLLTVAARLPTGGGLPVLAGLDPGELAAATEEATIEVVSGSDDRLVRRISMSLDLGPDALISDHPDWAGATRLTVDLGLSEPNRKLRIAPPRRALPEARLDEKWP